MLFYYIISYHFILDNILFYVIICYYIILYHIIFIILYIMHYLLCMLWFYLYIYMAMDQSHLGISSEAQNSWSMFIQER